MAYYSPITMNYERLLKFTVLVALLSLTLVSGTYAKYTSSVTGSDSAKVAKWLVKINDTNVSTNPATTTMTFDLFATLKDSDLSSSETDVAAPGAGQDLIIAPGTSGTVALVLKNESQVNATYSVAFTATNTSSIPVEYSLTGAADSWEADIEDLNIDDAAIAMLTGTSTVNVYWRWAFEGADSENFTSSQTDVTDTNLGIAAQTSAPVLTVTAAVTFTQVD